MALSGWNSGVFMDGKNDYLDLGLGGGFRVPELKSHQSFISTPF